MNTEKPTITKEPVQGREEITIPMLAGLTMNEILTLLAISIGSLMVFNSGKIAFIFGFTTYLYFRRLRKTIPDRFFSNAFQYYTQKYHVYIAGGRDYSWRPPVTPQSFSKKHTA